MPIAIVSEVWNEVKRYVSPVDRAEAAETVVNILIDNDFDVDDIKSNFKGDSDIRNALAEYINDDTESESEDDEFDDEDEDY